MLKQSVRQAFSARSLLTQRSVFGCRAAFSTAAGRRFTKDHEWVESGSNGVATIGITDFAQNSLGDIVFVDLPAVGKKLAKKTTFGVVESVKAASDIYCPVAGEVVEINKTLADAPETVNKAPFTEGWMIRVKVDDWSRDSADLMDNAAYTKYCDEVAH